MRAVRRAESTIVSDIRLQLMEKNFSVDGDHNYNHNF